MKIKARIKKAIQTLVDKYEELSRLDQSIVIDIIVLIPFLFDVYNIWVTIALFWVLVFIKNRCFKHNTKRAHYINPWAEDYKVNGRSN